jgi:hypothetical protein
MNIPFLYRSKCVAVPARDSKLVAELSGFVTDELE